MDIISFIGTMFVLTLMGLLIAFSPMLIIVDLLIVIKSKRPVIKAAILLAGMALPLLLLAYLATLFISPDSKIQFSAIKGAISIPTSIDILIGLVLVGFGLKKLTNRNDTQDLIPSSKPKTNIPDKPIPLFMFAFFKSLVSVTNIFAILVVSKMIVLNNLSPLYAGLVLLWTIAIGMIPFFTILYYHRFKKDYLIKLDSKLDTIMQRNTESVIIVLLIALGSIFLLGGVFEIISK